MWTLGIQTWVKGESGRRTLLLSGPPPEEVDDEDDHDEEEHVEGDEGDQSWARS